MTLKEEKKIPFLLPLSTHNHVWWGEGAALNSGVCTLYSSKAQEKKKFGKRLWRKQTRKPFSPSSSPVLFERSEEKEEGEALMKWNERKTCARWKIGQEEKGNGVVDFVCGGKQFELKPQVRSDLVTRPKRTGHNALFAASKEDKKRALVHLIRFHRGGSLCVALGPNTIGATYITGHAAVRKFEGGKLPTHRETPVCVQGGTTELYTSTPLCTLDNLKMVQQLFFS